MTSRVIHCKVGVQKGEFQRMSPYMDCAGRFTQEVC